MFSPVTGCPVAGLVILTLLATPVAPVTPKTTLPNARLAGETVSPAAVADVAEVASVLSNAIKPSATIIDADDTVLPWPARTIQKPPARYQISERKYLTRSHSGQYKLDLSWKPIVSLSIRSHWYR